MPTRPANLRPKLEASLADRHGLFRSNVAQGQQALRHLIDGRLTLTPREDHYEYKRVGTVQPMLGGLVQELVSPTGLDTLWIPFERWFPLDGSRRAA